MKKIILLTAIITFAVAAHAQSFAINTDGSTANASAMLDIKSNTKGLLIPRLTKVEKNAIAAPAIGLLIYQTGPDSSGFYYYQNSQWTLIADKNKTDSSYWSLHGNNNTTPPSSANNVPINHATDTYLGTFQPEDVSLLAGGNELLRLKQFSGGGNIGISNRNPEYGLDVRLTDPFPASSIAGMRIIPNNLFDVNNPVNINKGLVLGTTPSNSKETVLWNHGDNINASIKLGFDLFGGLIRPALTLTQKGQGIYQSDPKYMLDIHSRSQFTFNTPSTNKNGVRITYNNQEFNNTEINGLFMGVDAANNYRSYIWNYADGFGGNSPDKAIYFGVGNDMDPLYTGVPTMELQDGKIAIGRLINPTLNFPATLNLMTDYTASVAKNGISIIKQEWPYAIESAYMGTDVNHNMNIYKYNDGKILMGNPINEPITISVANQVGIKTYTPNADLQFSDTYANNKLVLHNNFFGNIPNNDHDFFGFGVNAGLMRYQIPRNNTAHVFYAGNNAGTASNELMRITGDGYVGINNNNPQAPLEFATGPSARKIVLSSSVNNDHNFLGFGNSPDGGLRYQIPGGNFEHVFYKGDNGGSSSTELFRVSGNGNIGVGASYPSAYGHTGTNRIVEIQNSLSGANDVQSHLILSTYGQSGSLGGITWAGLNLSGEQRTGFIGNSYETLNATRLVFYARSEAGVFAEKFNIQSNGNAVLQGTLTQLSDARFKTDIKPLNNSLQNLEKLNGYTYNWIDDSRDKEVQIGLIAQEVQKVYPQLVKQNDKGDLSVNYIGLIPILLEGIKEQQKQLDEQRKLIDQLLKKY